MSYNIFVRNKIIDFLTSIINNFLTIINIGDLEFKLDRFNITVDQLLTKLSSSLDVGFITKRLFIPNKFTPFYQVLNKMIYVNLLLSKHSIEIGLQHAKIF